MEKNGKQHRSENDHAPALTDDVSIPHCLPLGFLSGTVPLTSLLAEFLSDAIPNLIGAYQSDPEAVITVPERHSDGNHTGKYADGGNKQFA
jgi:hypothetical protein